MNHTLTSLDLRLNKIGDFGGQALGATLKVSHTLTFLGLEDNEIGDKIQKFVTELIKRNEGLCDQALQYAQAGDLAKLTSLLEQGVSAQSRNDGYKKDKNTLLHLAAQYGHVSICGYLLQQGASLQAKNKDKKTPLDLAREHHPEVIAILQGDVPFQNIAEHNISGYGIFEHEPSGQEAFGGLGSILLQFPSTANHPELAKPMIEETLNQETHLFEEPFDSLSSKRHSPSPSSKSGPPKKKARQEANQAQQKVGQFGNELKLVKARQEIGHEAQNKPLESLKTEGDIKKARLRFQDKAHDLLSQQQCFQMERKGKEILVRCTSPNSEEVLEDLGNCLSEVFCTSVLEDFDVENQCLQLTIRATFVVKKFERFLNESGLKFG